MKKIIVMSFVCLLCFAKSAFAGDVLGVDEIQGLFSENSSAFAARDVEGVEGKALSLHRRQQSVIFNTDEEAQQASEGISTINEESSQSAE